VGSKPALHPAPPDCVPPSNNESVGHPCYQPIGVGLTDRTVHTTPPKWGTPVGKTSPTRMNGKLHPAPNCVRLFK